MLFVKTSPVPRRVIYVGESHHARFFYYLPLNATAYDEPTEIPIREYMCDYWYDELLGWRIIRSFGWHAVERLLIVGPVEHYLLESPRMSDGNFLSPALMKIPSDRHSGFAYPSLQKAEGLRRTAKKNWRRHVPLRFGD